MNGQDGLSTQPKTLWYSLCDEDWTSDPNNIVGWFEEDADWTWPFYPESVIPWIQGAKAAHPNAKVILIGHSNGASGAHQAAGAGWLFTTLEDLGITVDLLYLCDLVPKPWESGNPESQPPKPVINVIRTVNNYQRDDTRRWTLWPVVDIWMQGWFVNPVAKENLWCAPSQYATVYYYINRVQYQFANVRPHTQMIFDLDIKQDLSSEINNQ